MTNIFNTIVNNLLYLNESFTRSYNFQQPSNFTKDEIFYNFTTKTGIKLAVQIANEYAESVLSPENRILIAFGRKLPPSKHKGWLKVKTDELLNVSDSISIISTVVTIIDTYINKFFTKNDIDTPLSINFYGSLTDSEITKDISLDDSKRSRIYLKALTPISKKYNMELHTYTDGLIELTNSD